MKLKRNGVLIIAAVALGIAVITAILLYPPPKRNMVIEVDGPPNRNFNAVFIVDGQRQTQTVTLPHTFQFQARKFSYRVTPVDKAGDVKITGRMYTKDGWADVSCEGWGVGGEISVPNLLGNLFGEVGRVGHMSYDKDDPGPEVTHPLQ